jgi:hypothetical protein
MLCGRSAEILSLNIMVHIADYIGLGMYREWKKIEFPKGYYIWLWEQQDWEVDQEIDGKMRWEIMEE